MEQRVETEIERAADLVADADALLVAAGAGMGIDSGLPDFRGPEGFWRAYPALGRRRLGFSQMANPQMFDTDPNLAWGFYGHRLDLYRRTVPHEGFQILKRWGARTCRMGAACSRPTSMVNSSGRVSATMRSRSATVQFTTCNARSLAVGISGPQTTSCR